MTTSVYLHIPFCESICTYCDFCKRFYDEELCSKYLDSLKKEVLAKYQNELIKTIYIGGGTPSSLSITNLHKLLEITKIFTLDSNYEFTIEVNPENINEDKLKLFKEYGVNRLSMGIETINKKLLSYLNRHHNQELIINKINLIKKYFDNINVDLIYAIPDESINDLKKDLDFVINLDIKHISTYSLIINDHTILGINHEKNIDEDLDYQMYQVICDYLNKHDFNHYELSNFSKKGYESQHNLVYWHNEHYYGFGLSASGYVNNIRYDNTKNMMKYLNGEYISSKEELDINKQISYELILGFRLLKGLNKNDFYNKYHINIKDCYNIKELIEKRLILESKDYLRINPDYLYVMNTILENFV